MLDIKNLSASIEGKKILDNFNLNIKPGEVHAIMGPNGSGKSTLSYTIAGRDGYEVTEGELLYEGRNVLEMGPDERAREGIFLAFQYPVEIPGVPCKQFLRAAVNATRKQQGEDEMDAVAFLKYLRQKMADVQIDPSLVNRDLNHGFSGGEKKRLEVLQMAMLEPKVCLLDETDSGLDIDALKAVADGVNALRSPERTMLIITHYQRLLDYIEPDFVHVLMDGRIARSGEKDLAVMLEEKGYDWVTAGA